MANNIHFVLFDNYTTPTEAQINDYRELMLDEMDEERELTDEQVREFMYQQIEAYWDDLFYNLKYSRYNDNRCIIIGRVGTWQGPRDITPEVCDDLETAIYKCVGECDCCIVEQECGHLSVTAIHHDGHNNFEIHLLNEKGLQAYDRIQYGCGQADLTNRAYHKAITGYIF